MIPIFIITRDRVTVLKKCIESYKKLGDIEIVIHDNESTYPPMLEYLSLLASEGVKIFKYKQTGTFAEISENVRNTINTYLDGNPDVKYYVVTDPDIELETPNDRLLGYYIEILEYYGVPVVGPMLRIDDLPDHFQFKKDMVKSHIDQFWDSRYDRIHYKESKVQFAAIDTTFGLYRRTFAFKRLNWGMRVHEPYMAKHLDWYIDTANPTEEEKYYREHASSLISTLTTHLKNGVMK